MKSLVMHAALDLVVCWDWAGRDLPCWGVRAVVLCWMGVPLFWVFLS